MNGWVLIGWLLIIVFAFWARVQIQHIYKMPTDFERLLDWYRTRRATRRYWRAVRESAAKKGRVF